MNEVALELPQRPRPEDFGLTEELVRSAPQSMFGSRRGLWILGLWGVAAVVVLAILFAFSGSLVASVALAIVAVAAASVLLVPGITMLVCALEFCERCLLCRRHEHYPALDRYRKAIEHYETTCRRQAAARARAGVRFWTGLTEPELVEEVARLYEARGVDVKRLPPDRAAGFDLVLQEDEQRTAVRCEAGRAATGRALGHEMAGARADLGVERMILVSPPGASVDLAEYLAAHDGLLLDAAELDRLRVTEPC
jgi:hypothetical protein